MFSHHLPLLALFFRNVQSRKKIPKKWVKGQKWNSWSQYWRKGENKAKSEVKLMLRSSSRLGNVADWCQGSWKAHHSISYWNQYMGRALCILGANVNLIPLFIYFRLKLLVSKPVNMLFQLADRICIHPQGIVEYMLLKVTNSYF